MFITEIADITEQIGEVGIEIEVEADSLPDAIVGWKREHDGSLRGESCEFVLRKPCIREKVEDYIGRVHKAYIRHDTLVRESARQSIHIHINVQTLTLTQVYNFIVLFLIFESSLVNFCGEYRKGNLFCLRSEDAEYLITLLERASSPSTFYNLHTDDIRYSALNVASLFKYGSLEFRSMRGTRNFELVKQWIDILLSIKDAAIVFDTPVAILEHYRSVGPMAFTSEVLGVNAYVVTEQDNWMFDVKMGMRRTQTMAYHGDWKGLTGALPSRRSPYDSTGWGATTQPTITDVTPEIPLNRVNFVGEPVGGITESLNRTLDSMALRERRILEVALDVEEDILTLAELRQMEQDRMDDHEEDDEEW